MNHDDGNPDRGPSDWFKLCNFDDLYLTANIGYVSLFVDTSGSMKLKTVKPSYNKFTGEVEARSKNVSLVWNPKEDCKNFTATKVFAAMEMGTSKLIQWVHLFMEDLGSPIPRSQHSCYRRQWCYSVNHTWRGSYKECLSFSSSDISSSTTCGYASIMYNTLFTTLIFYYLFFRKHDPICMHESRQVNPFGMRAIF